MNSSAHEFHLKPGAPGPPTHGRLAGAVSRLARTPIEIMRSPLARNGYALTASAGLTSVVGLAFWVLAAKLYSAEQLGISAALISTLPILGVFAQLNLGSVLNRFLPESGRQARSLVLVSYGIAIVAAFLVAAVFLSLAEWLVEPLAFLTVSPWMACWFTLAVVGWCIFSLQDSVLTGLRQAIWVPLENAAYAVAKIALLAFFASSAFVYGPFAAWTLPLVGIIAAVSYLIFWRLLPKHMEAAETHRRLDVTSIRRFYGWDYVAMLAMLAATGATPLLVLNFAGAEANAHYYVAETIAYSLYLIGRSMGQALLAEAAANRHRLNALAADALVHSAVPVGAAALLLFVAAPQVMGLFGAGYVGEGTTILRILAISTIPWALISIRQAVARAEGRTFMVAVVQGSILLQLLVLGPLLLSLMGASGMAVAWLAAQTSVALGIGIVALFRKGREEAFAWLIDLGDAAARFRAMIAGKRTMGTTRPDPEHVVRAILRAAGEAGADGPRRLRSVASQSDCLTAFLDTRGEDEPSHVLFKKTSSPEGREALERALSRLTALRSDARVNESGIVLPEILAVNRRPEAIRVLEARIPGEDGRVTIERSADRKAALAAAGHSIAKLHEHTAEQGLIDDQWLEQWIDLPLSQLADAPPVLMSATDRSRAIAVFRAWQYRFWRHRHTRLGWGHGDFSPGNIIFAEAYGRGGGPISVEGIVDWDQARPDAPAGFDACYLVVTARALARGEQLGRSVRQLLKYPRWDAAEAACLLEGDSHDPGGWPHDRSAIRTMVGLVWLRHISANIAKSHRYSTSRFWIAANVDWVLRQFTLHQRG